MHNRGGPPSYGPLLSLEIHRESNFFDAIFLSFFRESRRGRTEEATKSLLFYPHSKVDPPRRTGRGVSLPLSFPSIRSQIDFKAASIIRRAGGHSTRKINKDRKGTNFSWMDGIPMRGRLHGPQSSAYFIQNWP